MIQARLYVDDGLLVILEFIHDGQVIDRVSSDRRCDSTEDAFLVLDRTQQALHDLGIELVPALEGDRQ